MSELNLGDLLRGARVVATRSLSFPFIDLEIFEGDEGIIKQVHSSRLTIEIVWDKQKEIPTYIKRDSNNNWPFKLKN